MKGSVLAASRKWHRRIASLLFALFFVITLTGFMLGWKFLFTKTIFENTTIQPVLDSKKWLPIDSLEKLAAVSLNEITSKHYLRSERTELRLMKGYISFLFPDNYNVQLEGASGKIILIEQKNGGWIQDIHDGAIIDSWIGNKSGTSKTVYSTVLGLALLFLTISGFYLWYKPRRIKQERERVRVKRPVGIEVKGLGF